MAAGSAGVPGFVFASFFGSLFSHMGKHGPVILIRPEGMSEGVARYLEMVKPPWGVPNHHVNNYGWILGDTDKISWQAQGDIDWLLEPKDAAG